MQDLYIKNRCENIPFLLVGEIPKLFFLKKLFSNLNIIKNKEEIKKKFQKYEIILIEIEQQEDIKLIDFIKSFDEEIHIIAYSKFNNEILKEALIRTDTIIHPLMNEEEIKNLVFKKVLTIFKLKELSYTNKIIQDLANSSKNTLIAIFFNTNLAYMNQSFLDILGYKNIRDIRDENSIFKDFIQEIEGLEKKKKFLDYLLENKDTKLILKNSQKTYMSKVISYKELNKHLLILNEEL